MPTALVAVVVVAVVVVGVVVAVDVVVLGLFVFGVAVVFVVWLSRALAEGGPPRHPPLLRSCDDGLLEALQWSPAAGVGL